MADKKINDPHTASISLTTKGILSEICASHRSQVACLCPMLSFAASLRALAEIG